MAKNNILCVEKWCRNVRPWQGKYRLSRCWRCKSRRYKVSHESRYVFNFIKQRAKSRGVPWEITWQQWQTWTAETRYLELRGHKAGKMSIDRIDSDGPYSIQNIRMMEFHRNCVRHYDN